MKKAAITICLTLIPLAGAQAQKSLTLPRIDNTESISRGTGNTNFRMQLDGQMRVRAGWGTRQQIDADAIASLRMQNTPYEVGRLDARASSLYSNRIRVWFLGTQVLNVSNASGPASSSLTLSAVAIPGSLAIVLGNVPVTLPGGSLSATASAGLTASSSSGLSPWARLQGSFRCSAQGSLSLLFPHPVDLPTFFGPMPTFVRVTSILRFLDMRWDSSLTVARSTNPANLVQGSSTMFDEPVRLRVLADWWTPFGNLVLARQVLVDRSLGSLSALMNP